MKSLKSLEQQESHLLVAIASISSRILDEKFPTDGSVRTESAEEVIKGLEASLEFFKSEFRKVSKQISEFDQTKAKKAFRKAWKKAGQNTVAHFKAES